MEVDLSCYLAIHWYLLDTLLGYTLRIELIRVYARFWNKFITSNWLPHHHFLAMAPLSVNFTGQISTTVVHFQKKSSQVNLLSILPLMAEFSCFLYFWWVFYFLVISFDHNRSAHYDECQDILKKQLWIFLWWYSCKWKTFWIF
jgi:hypothetical protein